MTGTPAMTLGFTREELNAMEQVAWPRSPQEWVHDLVSVALGFKGAVEMAPQESPI